MINRLTIAVLIIISQHQACGPSLERRQFDPVTAGELDHKPIRILSIDGGGIRGLIPAILLDEIERATRKRIYELFDIFAGTSTGGIIALGLTTPNANNSGALLSAGQLVDLYETKGPTIFTSSCNFWVAARSRCLEKGPLYRDYTFENVLSDLVGTTLFKQALKPTLITSFEIEGRKGYSLESDLPAYDKLTMVEVARATSAAPTYFNPVVIKLKDDSGKESDAYMVDGGLYKNSPAILAYRKAKLHFGDDMDKRGFILVSLGTGKGTKNIYTGDELARESTETVSAIIDIAMEVSVNEDSMTMQNIAKENPLAKVFSIQTMLDNERHPSITKMDETSKENIQALREAAEDTADSSIFKSLVKTLKGD